MARVKNIISNILLLYSHNLEAFHIHNSYLDGKYWYFSHENECKWVRYASWCNVQHLTLHHLTLPDSALTKIPPPALFSCSRLVTLSLDGYVLTNFPINFIGFPHLISCYLCDVQLTDESLVSLILLYPLLQKLEIEDTRLGLSDTIICSSTIEHLSIERVKSLSINYPNLKVLSRFMISDLSVNGVRFYEFSSAMFKLKCASTPRELSLKEYIEILYPSRFLQMEGNFQSLTKLTIHIVEPFEREEEMDFPLMNLLHRLPNLQSLYMLGFFIQVFTQTSSKIVLSVKEMSRDPIPCLPCLSTCHLKKIKVEIVKFGYKK